MPEPIVGDAAEAAELEFGAAIVLDPLREFLDAAGLGSGEIEASELGDGHSNLTFLLRRGDDPVVLRRPPRGDLAGSANDVLREAKVLGALGDTAVPVPDVLGHCEDPGLIGAPFFLMSYVPGATINDGLPAALDRPGAPGSITERTVAALVALHAADLEASGLGELGRPSGYLERQLRRFGSLLEANATRPLPEMERVAEWLAANLPESRRRDLRPRRLPPRQPALRHAARRRHGARLGDGDGRRPARRPGYLTAMWAAPGDEENPMFALSKLTRRPDFPRREDLARAYAEASGEPIDDLRWYQVLALWKSAIFLEGSYRRFTEGASTDAYFASLGDGVPAVARTTLAWTERPDA